MLGGADGEMCGCPPGSPQFTHPIWGQRRERKRGSADAETPGERLALTAQQRRIMPGALSSSTDSNVMYGSNCAKEDQHNI